jgi:hypothetical protein
MSNSLPDPPAAKLPDDHEVLVPGMEGPSHEGAEYIREGGWFPPVCSLIRWLEGAGCCEYISQKTMEMSSLSHFPTLEAQVAALTSANNLLALIYNKPPPHLTPQKRKELNNLRRRAARFVQYQFRLIRNEQEVAEQAARNLKSRLDEWRKQQEAVPPPVPE